MEITISLFEAFLKCPTKCWLRATNEQPTGNEYAEWVKTQNDSYRVAETERLRAQAAPGDFALSPPVENLKTAQWRLAVDVAARTSALPSSVVGTDSTPSQESEGRGWNASLPAISESHLHAVERVPSEGRGKAAQFIPIRFVFFNKLGKDDKLLLAFDAFVLSGALGREIATGKIMHGDVRSCARESAAIFHEPAAGQPVGTTSEITTDTLSRAQPQVLKVKTSSMSGDVRKRLEKITALLANPTPPDLVLNRHCGECEFQSRCRKIAIEKDDLSLLGGMSAKERQKLRSKGIFTVTQLSYTFRPRRTPKRAKNPANPHHFPLQALAIRENTVYIHGTPELPKSENQVYLDIEGLPDRDCYYLIGALVVAGGKEIFHSFWADAEPNQNTIFGQFTDTVLQLPDFRVFHFGDYDAIAMRRIAAKLHDGQRQQLENVLQRSVNVLSLVHRHVYFPTYSNSLKELGRLLGFNWCAPEASGLNTVVWRETWQLTKPTAIKADLIQYNKDDCVALKRLCDFVARDWLSSDGQNELTLKVSQTVEGNRDRPHWRIFAPKQFAVAEFGQVNKCAYFDYQREKVLVRTHRQFKKINQRHRKNRKTSLRPNEIVPIESSKCPKCGKKRIDPRRERRWVVLDLKFSRGGVKKCVTQFKGWRYLCLRCGHQFSSIIVPPNPQRHGHGLMSWCVYWNVVRGVNMGSVQKSLGDLFEIFVPYCQIHRFKPHLVAEYQSLCAELLATLLSGPLIHVDETTVNLVGGTGYVWVMAGVDRVYYFYRPSREGGFLAGMLKPFSGVLVSDFYTAYDSLDCAQQKCLVHLIREIDDDLLRNPLDGELRTLAQEFGVLMRSLIETIDHYGLKRRHLHKHAKEVRRFLQEVGTRKFSSLYASKFQKRFQKSGPKMFTFLDYDGVPWNNNNAEHAIKRFAKHRRNADGRFTERSLKDYLVFASVLETCEFNNVNVLKFLLSKETTLEGLLRMAGRKAPQLASSFV